MFELFYQPARIPQIFRQSIDVWKNWFFNKRPEAHLEVTCELRHFFGQGRPQFLYGFQIIIHRSWKVHEVVEINWIIFSLTNIDLYRFFISLWSQRRNRKLIKQLWLKKEEEEVQVLTRPLHAAWYYSETGNISAVALTLLIINNVWYG